MFIADGITVKSDGCRVSENDFRPELDRLPLPQRSTSADIPLVEVLGTAEVALGEGSPRSDLSGEVS